MLVLQCVRVGEDLGRQIEDGKWAWNSGCSASSDDSKVPAHYHSHETEATPDLEVVQSVLDTSSGRVEAELVRTTVATLAKCSLCWRG